MDLHVFGHVLLESHRNAADTALEWLREVVLVRQFVVAVLGEAEKVRAAQLTHKVATLSVLLWREIFCRLARLHCLRVARVLVIVALSFQSVCRHFGRW